MAENQPAKKTQHAVNVGAQRVAAVYATGFIGAAEAAQKTDAVLEELQAVVEALGQFPQLETVLGSALVTHEEKSQILDRVFGSRLSGLTLDFLKVVSRHGRLDILRSIADEFSKLYDQLRGRIRVRLSTATPLTDGLSRSLAASLLKLLGGQPVVDSEVDPDLIGGVVVRVGDTVYDGSLARQLQQVRQQMITRSVHEIQSRRDRFRHPGGN
jgi:F-type H+-transporting ATPase subunit delta